MNRKFEELRNPNYVEKKEGDILDKIYGEQDSNTGEYKTEPLGGLRFNPQSAAFINIKSKYLDEVRAEDLEKELNSENQYLNINSGNGVSKLTGRQPGDLEGGLNVVNESIELKTDSKMLNGNQSGFLGLDETVKSNLMNPSSVNKPAKAYNHSVVTSKTRDSFLMQDMNVSEGSTSKKPFSNNRLDMPKIEEIHAVDSKESIPS
jgi:hypothetical protein